MKHTRKIIKRLYDIRPEVQNKTLEEVKNNINSLIDKFSPEAKIYLLTDYSDEGFYADVYLEYEDLESDEELQNRLAYEEYNSRVEREQYEKLKKKFEST